MGDEKEEEQDGTSLTRQLLKSQSGEFDLESIHILKIRRFDIDNLGCISKCVGLERLDLSLNDISNIQALASLKQLSFLNLSANRITNIEPLKELESLQTLNIAGNLVGSFGSLSVLTQLASLDTLRLRDVTEGLSNPVCNDVVYRAKLREMLPSLKTLDGERLSGKGSELFELFSTLDAAIEQGSKADPDPSRTTGAWVSNGFWEENDNNNSTVDNLQQAQTDFNEILQECRKLNAVATHSLAADPKT